ncbi:MAG: hypothetical protein R3343_10675 [Nitriliruptorales bacterium]|nr:hypothetical protein [Nitriliruptorales bacterium]
MGVNMHIRDVDAEVHEELVRRADAAGMSLRAYVIDVLRRHTSLPSFDEWVTRVWAAPPLPDDPRSSVELVEEGRREADDR